MTTLESLIQRADALLEKSNSCHNPSGPKGGQFCETGGGGGGRGSTRAGALNLSEGARVKIKMPGNRNDGKTGEVSQVSPGGEYYGVKVKGSHAGYFHESNLKPV